MTDAVTPRAEVLREAESLVCGDRNNTYGTPTQNFTNIAELWNVQFRHLLKDGVKFEPKDVALALIHVKMARTIAQPKRDNFVDLAGYAACGWETVESENEPEPVVGVVTPTGDWRTWTTTNADPAKFAEKIASEVDWASRTTRFQ